MPERVEAILAPEDEAALARLRALARLMDDSITIPGTTYRFGLDSLFGLLPVVGDTATALVSAFIIREAARLGAPPALLGRMTMNALLDWGIGTIPVAGDLFDAAWKANKKNVDLLERFLRTRGVTKGPTIDV